MKRFLLVLVVAALAVTQAFAADKAPASEAEKLGYSLGYNIGNNLKRDSVEAPVDQIVKGLQDAYQGKEGALSKEEMYSIVMGYQKMMMAKRTEEIKKIAEKNKLEGEAFLAENKKKPGVVVTSSGLQYTIITAGTGKKPKDTDTVKAHYRGTLPNGTEFDSSYKRGEPATFPVKGVIAGWTEVLQLMQEGAKWHVVIPSALAYGERGNPAGIGPNQVLEFDIELLKVVQP